MAKLPDDFDELERLYNEAVGKTIREWAELEILLGFYLTQLLQTDSFRARVVWSSMPNLRARVSLLRKLAATYIDDSALLKVLEVFDRIESLAGKRNILAHCLGGLNYKTKRVEFVRDEPDDELGMDFVGEKTFDLTNVLNWPNDIGRLRSDMSNILNVMARATYALPKMHRILPRGPSTPSDPTIPDDQPQSKSKPTKP